MSGRREDETDAARLLRSASAGYGDLPVDVADRLDRVLDQLPTADTLHAGEESGAERWTDRLRPKRVRYAIVSAAAALLVTVGGVALAVQVVTGAGGGSDEAGALADHSSAGESGLDEGRADDDADAGPEAEEFDAEEETQAESPDDFEATSDVETFASGTDYSANTDLLAALRRLGEDTTDATVPEELAELAEGGELWLNCQEAIARYYDGLVVAADFARFSTEPAVVALLVSDSGEIAVAVTPRCAEGVIEQLFTQQ
ncbi:hypothetical protein L0U85_02255 [Glycomyces sp. L485]|uniref:hypothetical protein n=1 Tax=Glycomyces sp. L485 TaxID=2909235 RepID=UPI001F4AD685|nr:hypothetical protein [Glycomyces sp. L485]MCH7229688.1 hypothetical protein [Glycomyces sp. L485]